ncbi:hypothetical protein AWC38_SpisGene2096 [Stylophora pistillata]|uniref:DDE Tnp4 domain-containing protein n=1 Tax=Stylophora pistillata TaxID=50429 RepID=A0A2B4SUH4_STYPI|nr:hypothetical protein AWC38_SpisGene2096 [Stylophora pistillata]
MFGQGKKTYPLFTEERGTNMQRLNPSLSKEIKTSLGPEREVLIAQKGKEIEKLQQSIQDDRDIADDENENPAIREQARERIAENKAQIDALENERERLEERLSLCERVRNIFKKYGFTVSAVVLAVGTMIGVIMSTLTKDLKTVAKGVGNGLKTLGKKIAAILPGLIGSIVSFVFRAAGSVISFLGQNAWVVIIGKPSDLYDKNNVDWAPTVNMGHSNIKDPAAAASRGSRAEKRAKISIQPVKNKRAKKKSEVTTESTDTSSASSHDFDNYFHDIPLQEYVSQDSDLDKGCQFHVATLEASVQTTETIIDLHNKDEYTRNLQCELSELKQKLLDAQLNMETFQNNNEKTQFYTGLPNFFMLIQVYHLVLPYIKSTSTNALTPFQELLLVLIRVRLNVPLQDLAYRFQIASSTAGRIFDRWSEVLSDRLGFLIHWPDRDQLRATMPSVFQKNFGNKVSVIIDCFEVFIERPSSLIARAMTWSNYKHHNTVKFLIGITTQGSISFISKAWGGRVSDKYLTENCGILRKLLPGDIVLADRGFDIADSVALQQAKLHIPAFTRGKKQLSAIEVETTRKIANVRIHVERVIGLARRKYTILQSILPITLLKAKSGKQASIDRIAKLCCALTNLSDSIVPFE